MRVAGPRNATPYVPWTVWLVGGRIAAEDCFGPRATPLGPDRVPGPDRADFCNLRGGPDAVQTRHQRVMPMPSSDPCTRDGSRRRPRPRYSVATEPVARFRAVSTLPLPDPEPFDRAAELAFLAAVLGGDREARVKFEERMHCVPRILHALNRRRGLQLAEEEILDLTHDTLLIALRKLHEFEAWCPLEGWIYRLCEFEYLNAVRRRSRRAQLLTPLGDDAVVPAPDDATRSSAHEEVVRGLDRLGGVEAELIRLKDIEGLTFLEIAARCGMAVNTAKTRYYRGFLRFCGLLRTFRRREDGDA